MFPNATQRRTERRDWGNHRQLFSRALQELRPRATVLSEQQRECLGAPAASRRPHGAAAAAERAGPPAAPVSRPPAARRLAPSRGDRGPSGAGAERWQRGGGGGGGGR